MLLIHCPYCDKTLPELEFAYAGEAHIARPADPSALSDEEWRDATETLLGDAALRKRMGDAGRRKVEEQYALAPWGARLADMLNTTIKEFHR